MSHTSNGFPTLIAPQERRRAARRKTHLRALLTVANQVHRVDVLDFSARGMLVSLVGTRPAASVLAQWIGMPAQLSTSSALSGYSLPALVARVVRIQGSRVGLEVDQLPSDWLNAFESVSSNTTNTRREEPKQLIKRCVGVYAAFARRLATDTLSRALETLAAREGTDPFQAQRTGLMEARLVWSAQRHAVTDLFVESAQRKASAGPAHAVSPSVAHLDSGSLKLMNAEELEDHLTLNGVISRLEKRFRAEIDAFETRYARLVGTTVDHRNDPFAPTITLRTFRESLQTEGIKPPAWRIFYEALETSAEARYTELWRDLAQIVGRIEPLPRPAPEPTLPRPAAREDEATSMDDLGARLNRLETAVAHRLIDRPPSLGLRAADTVQSGAARSNAAPGNGTIPAAADPAGAGRVQSVSRAPRRLDVIAELNRLAQSPEATRVIQSGELLPELQGAEQEATLEELIAAIDRLPLSSGPAFSEAGLREVAAQFIEQSATGPKALRRISETHQRVLYTAVQLFQQAGREFVPNSLIEKLVKRLERTLLKLSLRDGEFPASPEHPARKVIDLIDEYSIATDDRGEFTDPKLAHNLASLVDRICAQADHDDRIFTVVQASLERDLQSLRQERQQRVERICEALESRDRIRAAHAAVDAALVETLSERQIPRALLHLIADVWRQHLVFICLRHGHGSRPWEQSLRALSACLALTQEAGEPTDTLELRSQVATYIESMLQQQPLDSAQREAFLETCQRLVMKNDPTLIEDRTRAPRFDSASVAMPEKRKRPQIGEWWELKLEQNWVPVQLVWSSQSSDYCGLVNRSAQQRMELLYSELLQRLEQGTARTRAALDVPLLDRAEDLLLEQVLAGALDRANRDPETGVISRKSFQDFLASLERQSADGTTVSLAMFEFEPFRLVASTAGLEAMEALSTFVARALVEAAPRDATVAQFRDDTFVVALRDYSESAAIDRFKAMLAAVTDRPFESAQRIYRIGAFVGAGHFKITQEPTTEMLRRVEAACMAAKAGGRNTLRVYQACDADLHSEELILDWVGRIDDLFASSQLYLRCQMIAPVSPTSRFKPYYEVLLGVEPFGGHSISPFDLVSTMERLGRSHEIDLWVLREAFAWIRNNATVFGQIDGLSINLSAASLDRSEIRQFILDALIRDGLRPEHIVFEITESAAIRNFEAAQSFIRELRRFGVRTSLDDFGSGYTSYAHLKRLSVDALKIDGTYVKDILTSDSDLAIVRSMTDIAHTLGMRVVAEWVESPEILAKLLEIGVDYAQGSAVHNPIRLSRLLSPPQNP